MSKRSKEMALKAYPDIPLPHLGDGIIAKQGHLRNIFQEGYEQAEKDTIERIIGYLGKCDLEHTILGFDINGYAYIDFECLEKLIHKAMEEE